MSNQNVCQDNALAYFQSIINWDDPQYGHKMMNKIQQIENNVKIYWKIERERE